MSDEPKELKWRGTPISQLTDQELSEVHRECCRIAGKLSEEMQRRGLWGKR